MGQTVQLTIPKACHEDWQAMTAEEQGRYCNTCNKVVVDFTNMSDRDILQYLANVGGSRVCGRLHPDQLQRNMTIQKERRWPWLKYFFQFTLPAFLISMKAQAQFRDSSIVGKVMVQTNGTRTVLPDSSSTIRGRVVDHEGVALPGATIAIRGSNYGTTTDKDGYFSFDWPKDRNVVFFVSSVGFKTLRKKIKAKNRHMFVLLHLKLGTAILGDVIYTYQINKKPIV